MSFRRHGWPIGSEEKDAYVVAKLRAEAREYHAQGSFVMRDRRLREHDDLVLRRWRESRTTLEDGTVVTSDTPGEMDAFRREMRKRV